MGLIVGLGVFLAGIIGTVLSRLLADEFKAWTPWLVERLVRRAIARLPESHQARFGEEWRSHINEVPGEIGRIVVALGFLSAARKMSSIVKTGRERILLPDVLKRAVDLIASTASLVLYGPLFILVAVLIRLEGIGPALYGEERVGLNGQRFPMYTFRTMEIGTVRVRAPEHDPRSTRIGRLLRKYSFDRLPLFINVFRGEMSLIGPRAKPASVVAKMSEVSRYGERARVKPGITGWAQVKGSSDPYTELADDLYYIENRSLRLDLTILLQMVIKILT